MSLLAAMGPSTEVSPAAERPALVERQTEGLVDTACQRLCHFSSSGLPSEVVGRSN